MYSLSNTMFAPVACTGIAAAILAAVVARAVLSYQRSFIATIGASLKQSFVLTNPRAMFLWSIALTVVSGSAAFAAAGPVACVVAIIASLTGPWLIARRIAERRRKQFVYQLPDALLALGAALRAGSTLTRGLELMASRQPAPLCQEFSIVLAEQRIGRPLAESLDDLRRRVGAPELDLMNTAMNVSRRVGGNLADTLESLARTLQEKAHVEGKIDALTSMGRAQGWVVGLLPIFIGLVLYQQQPERMSLLFTQWYGWIVLVIIAGMMALAAWLIRKIVRIDV
ncbi:type II secretion system F family protein [Steroidobacter sp. S1-65]|uniref:Type II secretion system F family protein n=1 Tax=Steroidobacter gossypii TaxID=2805490 RepID=A0ABS1WSY9_9GAMM|nr:type II secretion system F family protein [Steroidobacter gossypii]MBM0104089.1 type II secretion system F family protein [Steroidobacter gossypii]